MYQSGTYVQDIFFSVIIMAAKKEEMKRDNTVQYHKGFISHCYCIICILLELRELGDVVGLSILKVLIDSGGKNIPVLFLY